MQIDATLMSLMLENVARRLHFREANKPPQDKARPCMNKIIMNSDTTLSSR